LNQFLDRFEVVLIRVVEPVSLGNDLARFPGPEVLGFGDGPGYRVVNY
jgi:hypothetical protein